MASASDLGLPLGPWNSLFKVCVRAGKVAVLYVTSAALRKVINCAFGMYYRKLQLTL
jgi:hypothetical protein